MEPKILLIGDDASTRELVWDALREEHMRVETAEDCSQVLRNYFEGECSGFDLLLLDTDLAEMDGFSVCREVRAKTSVPIVMLSGRNDETSVVVGLEVGADDYLTKPFNVRELTSRIRAHLRRQRRNNLGITETADKELLEIADLEIDLLRYRVSVRGEPVALSAAQFKILTLLASHPGRVYSREQIMEPIWGTSLSAGSRAADVHIQNIRRKIEPDPTSPCHILTVRGAGYCFAEGRD